MILIREFDQLAIELRKGRRIHGALHPYVGEEAVAVGACAALRPTDRITSTHRGHGHCIRSEEHTSELQSRLHLVCRLLLEKKKKQKTPSTDRSNARKHHGSPRH